MSWPNLQSINKSIAFNAVPRYSVWEEQQKCSNNLSDYVTRLNVNTNSKQLKVIVANCIDSSDETNQIIEQSQTSWKVHSYAYGTLESILESTIDDQYPGGNNLMQYWKEKGFSCLNPNVNQVIVRVKTRSITPNVRSKKSKSGVIDDGILSIMHDNLYTYPADKVWRLCAYEKYSLSNNKLTADPMVNQSLELYPFTAIKFSPREAFIAPEGYTLLSADYSQIELRLLANFANDTKMIETLTNGSDIMREMASILNHKSYESVTDDERQRAKTVVYGMLYGQTYYSLANELQISKAQAKAIYDTFNSSYPLSAAYLVSVVDKCREQKYITTLLGRRRYLQHINHETNQSLRLRAERQAINSLCQGSAADLIKIAMIRIYTDLQILDGDGNGHHMFDDDDGCELMFGLPKYSAKLVLQIHDELLFEVRDECLENVAQIVKRNMENCVKLKVPIRVNIKIGQNWGMMREYLN